MLREAPPLLVLGDAVVMKSGGRLHLVSLHGDDEPEEVSADSLREFQIVIPALARYLRERLSLSGSGVEVVTPRLTFLGSRGQGARREAVHLSQGMSAARALADAAMVRSHDPAPRHVILVPTERSLPVAVSRQVEAQGVHVVVLDDLLKAGAAPGLPIWGGRGKGARLVVDAAGGTCKLEGRELELTRREIAVLAELASEAANEGGFVDRDRIAEALEDATGHGDRQDEQIDKVVSQLRSKLKPAFPIDSRRRVGWRLRAEPGEVNLF